MTGPALPLFAALGCSLALVQLLLFEEIAASARRMGRILAVAAVLQAALISVAFHHSVAQIVGTALAVALVLVGAAAMLVVVVPRGHLALTLTLSTVGYSLAAVYTLFAAPNVALVAVLVETVFTLLLLAALAIMPRDVLARQAAEPWGVRGFPRDAAVGLIAGSAAFLVAWAALSQPAREPSVATEHVRLTPVAHASNVVSAILADFRGLDTLGEITVIGIVFVGVWRLLARSTP
jgi:multicomponent Na+:H+ antiporter subunit A